jgi:hypothetical protein
VSQPHRRHRWLVAGIFTLAVITGLVAILSTYARRQALNTNNWANTSTHLLESKNVQDALGAYLVNQLFTNVDVAGALEQRLPPQFDALAGPVSGGLRQLADRAAPQLLARPRVQDAWALANRNAHKQFLAIINGGGKTVSTQNGEVVLDLRSVVDQLASTLGIESQVAAARQKVTLPPSAAQLVIMKSTQLQTAQDIAKAIKGISIIFTVLSLALFALAVWLAQGWRRVALRTTGWCFAGLGLAVLVVRRWGGNYLVDHLVRAESVKPAAHDTWTIGTSLLWAIAFAFVIYGLVLVVAAWLAGPTRWAVSIRKFLAPQFREHPGRIWAAVGFVYLLVLVWGPTPALRHIVPILIIAALIALGVEVLRRQVLREYPATLPPAADGAAPAEAPDKVLVGS